MESENELFQGRYRIPSARLTGYDYGANGTYFVTICTKDRHCFFGTIDPDTNMINPTPIGQTVIDCWQTIPTYFPFVGLDAFVLMPNHVHGILWIDKPDYTDWKPNQFGPQRDNLAAVLRGFKAGVTRQARAGGFDFGWQPRYHDRIVRNNDELTRIQQYIENNPANWHQDHNNPDGLYM